MSAEIPLIAGVLLGLVFAWSCVSKVREFGAFWRSLPDFAAIPPRAAPVVAVLVVAAEGVAALLLLTGAAATASWPLAFALLTSFALPVARNALRAAPLPCHCFGAHELPQPRWALLRLVLLFAVLAVYGTGTPQSPTMTAVLGAAGALVLGFWAGELPLLITLWGTPATVREPIRRRFSYRADTDRRLARAELP